VLEQAQPIRLNTAERLAELAKRVRRLAPSHRDPERYHVEKSEIEHELRGLAHELGAK
jgi:hypothetical protein